MRNIKINEVFEPIFGSVVSFQEALENLKEQKIAAYQGISTSSLHPHVATFIKVFTKKFEALNFARAVINSDLVSRKSSQGKVWLLLVGGALLNLNTIPLLGSTSAYGFAAAVEIVDDKFYEKINRKVENLMAMPTDIDQNDIIQLVALALGKSLENQLLILKDIQEVGKFAHYLAHRIEKTTLKSKNFNTLGLDVAQELHRLSLADQGKSSLIAAQMIAKHFFSNAFKSDEEMGNVTLVKKNGVKTTAFHLISKPGIITIDQKGAMSHFTIEDKTDADKFGYRTTHIAEVKQLGAHRQWHNKTKRFYKTSKSPVMEDKIPSVDFLEESLAKEKYQRKTRLALTHFEIAKQKYLDIFKDFSKFLIKLPTSPDINPKKILAKLERSLPDFPEKSILTSDIFYLMSHEHDLIELTEILNKLCQQILELHAGMQAKCVLDGVIDYSKISGSSELQIKVKDKINQKLLAERRERLTPPSSIQSPISESKFASETETEIEVCDHAGHTYTPFHAKDQSSSKKLDITSPEISDDVFEPDFSMEVDWNRHRIFSDPDSPKGVQSQQILKHAAFPAEY